IFEGPFDLLLKLIDKNKIDIYNIPISKLTDDYLEYIKNMQKTDLDEISEFILMASTLLKIKSKMLLPIEKDEKTDEELDPREELVKKLIEYKKYKLIAKKLAETEVFLEKVAFKSADASAMEIIKEKSPLKLEEILEGINLNVLYSAFEDVLKRKELKTDRIRSSFNSVTKSLYNINDKITYIKDLVFLENKISFNKIFEESNSKIEIVVTFLAVLELIKVKDIKVSQNNIFGEIIIEKGEAY
ncbi:MAG: segregation/condensation protein A, partial [Eubacteriales bacterium]|nr:segregation/condensation protein A [Eubacteriales bacterium]